MPFTQASSCPSTSAASTPLVLKTARPVLQDCLPLQRHSPRLEHYLRALSAKAKLYRLREDAESCTPLPFTLPTHEVGRRRMMRAELEHASSAGSGTFHFTIPGQGAIPTTLEFTRPSPLDMGLSFLPRPPPSRPKKRSRAAADVDGEHSCMQKKKRRLRLFLITSRLSPQFSHPATNIVDRGSSKIAVWAKQKALGRNLLRKAAILNRVRRRAISAREAEEGRGRMLVEQEKEQKELELARLEFEQGSVDTYTRPVLSRTSSPPLSRSPSPPPPSPPLESLPEEGGLNYRSPNEAYAYSPLRAQLPRKDYLPLPPSPLGLSNYDAFDADDDIPDPYARFDDEDEPFSYPYEDDNADDISFSSSSTTAQAETTQPMKTLRQEVYSNFNVLDPEEAVCGDYDQVDEGANAVWPSSYVQEAAAPITGSTSPDFPALFATAPSPSSSPSKRTDSFATSPNFRPHMPAKSVSPNFPPAQSYSPNFTPSSTLQSSSLSLSLSSSSSSSSSFTAPTFTSPNYSSPSSPSFITATDPLPPHKRSNSMDAATEPPGRPPPPAGLNRSTSDMEQERRRQRNLMFMRFGT